MIKNDVASKPQEIKCELCNDTGWVYHSDCKSKKEGYDIFKLSLFVECSCKLKKKAG